MQVLAKLSADQMFDLLYAFKRESIFGWALMTETGTFRLASRAFSEMVGYTEAELQNMTWRDITIPGDVQADQANVDRILRGEQERYDLLKTYVHKGGWHVPVLLRVVKIEHEDGTFDFFLSQVAPVAAAQPQFAPSVDPVNTKTAQQFTADMVRRSALKWGPWVLVVVAAIGGGIAALAGGSAL